MPRWYTDVYGCTENAQIANKEIHKNKRMTLIAEKEIQNTKKRRLID